MVRPAGWSGCGSSPTVLASRRGGVIIGRNKEVTFESKLTRQTLFGDAVQSLQTGGQSRNDGTRKCGHDVR